MRLRRTASDVLLAILIATALVPALLFARIAHDRPDETFIQHLRMLVAKIPVRLRSAVTNPTEGNAAHAGYLTRDGIIDWTNTARKTNGLSPLNTSPILDAIAEKRVFDMQSWEYVNHVSPTRYGANDMAGYFKYRYLLLGENIAFGSFADDADLVRSWMSSPRHHAIIVNKHLHEIGAAVGIGQYNGRDAWIAVEVFGLPVWDCPQVDQSLLNVITAEKVHKLRLERGAAELKRLIDAVPAGSEHDAEYNEKVRIYNVFVKNINYRAAAINRFTVDYNAQLLAYDDCVGGPQEGLN